MERDFGALQAQFKIEAKSAEARRKEAVELLKTDGINERDRLRVTRVLQMVDRFAPERKAGPDSKLEIWSDYLKTLYRSLPARKAKYQPRRNYTAESAMLAENVVTSLRNLRSLDRKLTKEPAFTQDEIVNQEQTGEVESHETINSSLTLDYEKKNWGPERICLDGIQNHLPSDAKGERVLVRFEIGDKWVTLPEAKLSPDKVRAVRFIDDGVGFDVKNLDLLYSTKSEEEESRGQFGEGMKMMAAAALREGLDPELESQNWRAKPVAKTETLRDTRNNKDRAVQRLAFEVDHLNGKPLVGSRTTFRKPSREFLDEALQLEEKVLAMRENYRPVLTTEAGDIVDTQPGKIFVKGIYVKSEDTLFSYNFDDVETNRDRNEIVSSRVGDRIERIVSQLSSKGTIKALLTRALGNPGAMEARFYDMRPLHPSAWKDAFHEQFGEDAVIDTDFKAPEVFQDIQLNKINFGPYLNGVLLRAGVHPDSKALPRFYNETINTSLTSEYGKEVWAEERIMLDAMQNHLPSDSGGNSITLRFKTKDGGWHGFEELPDFGNDQISDLKIYDNGKGYDSRTLGFFYSGKDGVNSAGKFGEGLKMLSLACLRKGVRMSLSSRDWMATPRYEKQEIDGKEVDQLVYDVTHFVGERNKEDDQAWGEKSATVFHEPTSELVEEFRSVNRKVLAVEQPKPVDSTKKGDILSLSEGSLFVHQVLIPGDKKLLFSYHFPYLDIKNRDRSLIEKDQLEGAVRDVLAETQNPEVIRSFLYKANLAANEGMNPDAEKVEFGINFEPKDPEQWKQLFQEIFGENTAIRDVKSQDFDAMGQNEHVGLKLVSFPSDTYRVLSRVGLTNYEERVREMTDVDVIPNEEVNEEEREVIAILHALDKYLPGNQEAGIKLYNPKTEQQAVASGFWKTNEATVYLLRSLVKKDNLLGAADVYYHEKTHQNTGGAKDAAADFRNYLTMALANLGLEQLKRERPDLVKD